jgi:hypothetical protein
MNGKQRCVLAAALGLLILNFVFPYSSTPEIESIQTEDELTIRSTVRTGFLPFWEVQKRQADSNPVLKDNPFGDTYILWPWLGIFAVIIVFTAVGLFNKFRDEDPVTQKAEEPKPATSA